MSGDQVAALRSLIEQVRPVTASHERTLPVLPALEQLLPFRGLQRGTMLWVGGGSGATSLAFGLAAGPTQAGSWVACVAGREFGWASAAELGVDLHRVAVVRSEPADWAAVTAALVDAFDVVLCGPDHQPERNQVLRLAARARERGSVVVAVGGDGPGVGRGRVRPWPGVDVRLDVDDPSWDGIGAGWGSLRGRQVAVRAGGRHGMDRTRRVDLRLPGDGGVEPIERSGSPGDRSPDGPSPLPVEGTPGDGTGAEVLAFRARPA
jgi:hypothetical protein